MSGAASMGMSWRLRDLESDDINSANSVIESAEMSSTAPAMRDRGAVSAPVASIMSAAANTEIRGHPRSRVDDRTPPTKATAARRYPIAVSVTYEPFAVKCASGWTVGESLHR